MLCLKNKKRGIVSRQVPLLRGGSSIRYFIVTREGFWRFYERMRQQYPGDISYTLIERFTPSICCQCFIDDPEIMKLTNLAYGWEGLSTPPWELYPDMDRVEMWGLSNIVRVAKGAWMTMRMKKDRQEAKGGKK